jgi:hypothetical protein
MFAGLNTIAIKLGDYLQGTAEGPLGLDAPSDGVLFEPFPRCLVQRFDGLNHIRLLRRVYMTKCG